MFHHILVAVDGSAHAHQALTEAVDLAQAQHADLTIIVGVPQPALPASLSADVAAEFRTGLDAEFDGIARDAEATVPPEIGVETIVTHELVRDALTEQVAAGHFDLLVMGSRGRGAIRSAVLGSVSHRLLNHSSIPVLIVNTKTLSPLHDTKRVAVGAG